MGRDAIISQRSHLCSASHDFQSDFQLVAEPIDIGAKAWVAADAFVGPGVQIGEGAVIGARCVVTRSVDAWSVVVGNPARRIGQRTNTARNLLHNRGSPPIDVDKM